MDFKSKKEFMLLRVLCVSLLLTIIPTILDSVNFTEISLVFKAILTVAFIYGIVTFCIAKLNANTEKMLKDMGIRYECQRVDIKFEKFIFNATHYSFYLICEYIDSEGNAQLVTSKPYVIRKDKDGIVNINGKLQLNQKYDVVLYVEKVTSNSHYIDIVLNELI